MVDSDALDTTTTKPQTTTRSWLWPMGRLTQLDDPTTTAQQCTTNPPGPTPTNGDDSPRMAKMAQHHTPQTAHTAHNHRPRTGMRPHPTNREHGPRPAPTNINDGPQPPPTDGDDRPRPHPTNGGHGPPPPQHQHPRQHIMTPHERRTQRSTTTHNSDAGPFNIINVS
ncbi:hypothetical protein K443DRAFT_13002 [Laccaria amethystina LaAM-08-1]|uniref:Uncharacterized protein n=1 Tax=Laccaria amethystina LaAM-08-1 TaxID=1095629 RepID=A0A0C9WWL9_9AGAR|nr:hypothetical protein K443DRAFT_13002 [Laccaria amethystina LaAM-08-1]